MGENNQEWSWVGEDGIEHDLDESELTFSLSSEELPAHILVTKLGWGEWLPAMQVAELQWALPAGRSDNPRKPSAGHKPPPPLDRYAALKKRARDIATGVIDPASESSLAMPAVQLMPRPQSSAPTAASAPNNSAPSHSAPIHALPQSYSSFSLADSDEPTLQLDADELDAALEFARDEGARAVPAVANTRTSLPSDLLARQTSRLGSKPEHVAPPPEPGSSPFTASNGGLATSGSSSQARMPGALYATGSYPAVAAPAPGSSPPPAPPFTTPGPRPVSQYPKAPSPHGQGPFASDGDRRSAVVGSSPSFPPVVPQAEHTSAKWLWITILAGLVSASVLAVWLRSSRVETEITAPIQTPVAPPTKVPVPTSCKTSVSPLPLAGWIYPNVRPIIARAPGPNSLLVGYAQTSRMSAGLIVDTAQLNSQKPFTAQGSSPLLSVAPVTQALGQQASFLESRAASTLQSAVFISTKVPFALGINHDGLAIRRENEQQDTVVWKPQWDTISVPLTARLDDRTHAVLVRGGGERGRLLVGRLNDDAEPQGEMQEMVVDAPRLGTASLTVASRKVLIAVDAANRENTVRKLYLASAEVPRVPIVSEVLPISDDNPVTPTAIALRDGTTFIAYARGQVGSQNVVARLLDKKRGLLGPLLEISPKDKDAFGPELALDGDRVVLLFIVRQGNNNELWATGLDCLAGED